jgi:purine-nucleoside phosphorylase
VEDNVTFPIFPEKHKLPALLTAEKMIEFRRKHGGLGDLAAPHSVVLCLYKGVMRRFAWRYPSRPVDSFLGDLYLLKRTNGTFGVMGNFGIGAPALTSVADELMAWGVRRLVIFSLAGALQPDLGPGDLVVCDRAIRDEGTSYHYLAPARDVLASDSLVSLISGALDERGLRHSRGATWSTDAPYRETREEAEQFQREGIKAVDMESAGLFAAAQVRGVDAASAFVIGDSLAGPRWSAPPDMRSIHLKLKLLLDVLTQALSQS